MNRPILAPFRIVSLVPSQTELLYDLGLGDRVVGITKFCIHPDDWLHTKTIVGGTKKISIPKIKALKPDLILANKEENTKEEIEALLAARFPLWVSDIHHVEDALAMIRKVGILTHTETQAHEISIQIQRNLSRWLMNPKSKKRPKKVLYLIWRKPYMAAGCDTFIHDMLRLAGYKNVLSKQKRYPELKPTDLQQLNPEVIFLSSEPFPFKEKHIAELQEICPNATVRIVDGELFSWYGSRMLKAGAYFEELAGGSILQK